MDASFRSGFHDDLDAAVVLGSEGLVELWALLKCCAMRDDERRIDFAFLDAREKLGQVMLHRRLRHPKCQPAIDRRTHRDFVNKAAVNANDGHDAKISAAMDRLTKHVRPIRSHER